ncbi:hypothetical protein [Paracoccus mutanolyticus]|uniref:hypothetical protein n=1 Tax=Paracoccus mutanolyticus TaxID=1499308 RepID=UPI0016784EB7|nr:hypothetical protein [Paracoccus mutanolyticus]
MGKAAPALVLVHGYLIAHHYDAERGPRVEGGRIRIPSGPGLGVTPDLSRFGAPVLSFG